MSARKKTITSSTKKPVEQVPIESIEVRLKPVFGVKPRTYVPIIWAIAAVAVIFLLLFLPGLKRNGTWITFQSDPPDASVIVDGIRLGATGEPLFVARGLRKLTLRRVGFEDFETEIPVSGRIFASMIFPGNDSLSYKLKPSVGFDHKAYGIGEFASWAATGPEKGRYAIPPVLTQTARDILAAGTADNREIIYEALPMSIDERHLADIFRSQLLLESGGAPPGIGNITEFVSQIAISAAGEAGLSGSILELVNENRFESAILTEVLSEKNDQQDNLVKEFENIYSEARAVSEYPSRLYGNELFIAIPEITAPVGDLEVVAGGYFPRSGASPVRASVKSFSISTMEITNNDFSVFLDDHPEWSVENRENLVGTLQADEEYLSDWSISGPAPGSGRLPVTNISWFAAMAYAEWFTGLYLTGTGQTARLPREDEWEIAARLNGPVENTADLQAGLKSSESADTGSLGIRGMSGNVREWALNPFRLNENLFRPSDGSPGYQDVGNSLSAPERPVRGGAHIDGGLAFPAAVRGGLRPEITSPVIGFRLVIVPVDL